MSDDSPPGDPSSEADPEEAAREVRRREREARREGRVSSQGGGKGRRSLAGRVGEALGRGSDADEPGPADEPAPADEPGVGAQSTARVEGSPDLWFDEPATVGPGNGSPDRRTLLVRRAVAVGAAVVALIVIFVLISRLGGGEDSAPAVAEEPLAVISVVVPEGLTIEQIADVSEEAKLTGSYKKAAKKALKDFPLKRYDAQDAPSLEGFLFPATYELEKGARARDLVDKQLQAFEENFGTVNLKSAKKKNLTAYDVLIIASMIEEEVQVASERKKVSAVIYNRLAAGTTLGIDATLRYELGNYDEQLKESELAADTPYNTRLSPGLPPTPIANPGLASIEAAADPANSDIVFFVVKPDTCGEHVFTASEAEFLDAQAAYQEALAAEGGAPTDCS